MENLKLPRTASRRPRTTTLTAFPLVPASTQTDLLAGYPSALARRLSPETAAVLLTLCQRHSVSFRVPRAPERTWRTLVLWHQDKPLADPDRSRALKFLFRKLPVAQRRAFITLIHQDQPGLLTVKNEVQPMTPEERELEAQRADVPRRTVQVLQVHRPDDVVQSIGRRVMTGPSGRTYLPNAERRTDALRLKRFGYTLDDQAALRWPANLRHAVSAAQIGSGHPESLEALFARVQDRPRVRSVLAYLGRERLNVLYHQDGRVMLTDHPDAHLETDDVASTLELRTYDVKAFAERRGGKILLRLAFGGLGYMVARQGQLIHTELYTRRLIIRQGEHGALHASSGLKTVSRGGDFNWACQEHLDFRAFQRDGKCYNAPETTLPLTDAGVYAPQRPLVLELLGSLGVPQESIDALDLNRALDLLALLEPHLRPKKSAQKCAAGVSDHPAADLPGEELAF